MPLMEPPKYPVFVNREEYTHGLIWVEPGHVRALEAVGWCVAGELTADASVVMTEPEEEDEGEDNG